MVFVVSRFFHNSRGSKTTQTHQLILFSQKVILREIDQTDVFEQGFEQKSFEHKDHKAVF